jgi:hypothetical protein
VGGRGITASIKYSPTAKMFQPIHAGLSQ